jgi:hypothetical protein
MIYKVNLKITSVKLNTSMQENINTKELIIKLLLEKPPKEENNSGYYTFAPEVYQQIFQSITDLIKNEDTELVFDLKNINQNTDYQPFNRQETIEEYRFVRQSGSDIYSYIKLKAEAIAEPILLIGEELPAILGELIGGNLPKNQCAEWMEVYPYILKALLDDCLNSQMIGLKYTLLEVKFHPVDFKPYAYYICARRLLNKMNEKWLNYQSFKFRRMQVQALDLTTQKYVFDGEEPNDWYQPIQLPYEPADWHFTLAELTQNPFQNLRSLLGEASFAQIIEAQNTKPPTNEFQVYEGSTGLQLYYFLPKMTADSPDYQALILISFGEFQPARYMAHLEGLWKIAPRPQ